MLILTSKTAINIRWIRNKYFSIEKPCVRTANMAVVGVGGAEEEVALEGVEVMLVSKGHSQ